MNVVVRTDASLRIGTGHVMRCLALAIELRRAGHGVEFVCGSLAGNLAEHVERRGIRVHRLPRTAPADPEGGRAAWLGTDWQTDAEQTAAVLAAASPSPTWLVVDHYALGHDWEVVQRPHVENIFVIDDLADRPHGCDLLLDQNFPVVDTRYRDLVPPWCRRLLGPRYALLREEFRRARATLRERTGELHRILVFFGGVDVFNDSARVLRALRHPAHAGIAIDLVVGATNPHVEELRALVAAMPDAALHNQVDNMAELMARADFAICAAGSATLERCCLGLPSAMIATADNQTAFAQALAEHGYAFYLGDRSHVTEDDIVAAVARAKESRELLKRQSEWSLALVDGLGCERVADALVNQTGVGDGRAWSA